MSIQNTACAYCNERRAVNRDHVVPKSYVKKLKRLEDYPRALLETVPACFECNMRKQARRLVPQSWAKRVRWLNRYFPGAEWRVWDGDPMSPAFREVHV